MNFAEFQRVFKGEAWRDCTAALSQLWEDQGTSVCGIHNVVLQVYLDNMLHDYINDIACTRGNVATNIDGNRALGGQQESIALLKAHVNNFITFIQSGILEGMSHTAFYGDVIFTRILNKPPWATAAGQDSVGVGLGQQSHMEVLCIWALAGMLEMKSTLTGQLFAWRTAPREHPIQHAPLFTVTVGTVFRLFEDPEFTRKVKESFKAAVTAKVETDTWRFLEEE